MTGYLLFGNSIRNELIAEMEGSSMTQITEEIGRRWSALPDAEKEVALTFFSPERTPCSRCYR